jgi:hypothetical protein
MGVLMKRGYLYFALLLVAIFLTFSVVNIASAIPIKTWDHKDVKFKDVGFVEMNEAIETYNAKWETEFKIIVDEYWASHKTDVEEGDFKEWTFNNLEGVEYLLIKAGTQIELYYVGDVATGSFTWEGTKGLSNFSTISPVPEPASMLLLGTGLVGLIVYSRKKIKKT